MDTYSECACTTAPTVSGKLTEKLSSKRSTCSVLTGTVASCCIPGRRQQHSCRLHHQRTSHALHELQVGPQGRKGRYRNRLRRQAAVYCNDHICCRPDVAPSKSAAQLCAADVNAAILFMTAQYTTVADHMCCAADM